MPSGGKSRRLAKNAKYVKQEELASIFINVENVWKKLSVVVACGLRNSLKV